MKRRNAQHDGTFHTSSFVSTTDVYVLKKQTPTLVPGNERRVKRSSGER